MIGARPCGPSIVWYNLQNTLYMVAILPYIQIVLSVLLVAAILFQRSEAGLGGAFGGDSFSGAEHTRRGFEKNLFYATIVIAILFGLSAFIVLLV